jgi:hypothetical protein
MVSLVFDISAKSLAACGQIARWRSDHFGLVVGSPAAAAVDRDPNVGEAQKRGRTLAQYRGAEHIAIKRHRPLYVCNNECISHHKFEIRRLIRHNVLLSCAVLPHTPRTEKVYGW